MVKLRPDFAFTNDTPCLALTGQLWGVFHEIFGGQCQLQQISISYWVLCLSLLFISMIYVYMYNILIDINIVTHLHGITCLVSKINLTYLKSLPKWISCGSLGIMVIFLVDTPSITLSMVRLCSWLPKFHLFVLLSILLQVMNASGLGRWMKCQLADGIGHDFGKSEYMYTDTLIESIFVTQECFCDDYARIDDFWAPFY